MPLPRNKDFCQKNDIIKLPIENLHRQGKERSREVVLEKENPEVTTSADDK